MDSLFASPVTSPLVILPALLRLLPADEALSLYRSLAERSAAAKPLAGSR